MPYKWTGVLIAVILVPSTALANVLLDTLTDREVPGIINLFAVATAVVATVIAFVAHIYQLTAARLNHVVEAFGSRLEQLEGRFGDYNAGFVAGYLLGDGRDPATVLPMTPRSARRAVTRGDD
jgi:hypothetical protein